MPFARLLWTTFGVHDSWPIILTVVIDIDQIEQKDGEAEVGTGFVFAIWHTGSIAIAAFIIAVIRLIRFIFYHIARKAEESSGEN